MKTLVSINQELFLPQVDITNPLHGVEIQTDVKRKVIYVTVDGITVLRICRCPSIEVVEK